MSCGAAASASNKAGVASTGLKQTQPWCRLVFDDGRAISLRGERFTVGRAETNDLIGDQPQLSGLHCSLCPGEDKEKPCLLTDTSSNGTFVDGAKVHKASRVVPWGSRVEVVKGKKGICFVLRSVDEEGDKGDAGLARNTTVAADAADLDNTVSDDDDKATAAVLEQMNCCICMKVLHKPVPSPRLPPAVQNYRFVQSPRRCA